MTWKLSALIYAIKVNRVSEWLDSEQPGNSEQCCTELNFTITKLKELYTCPIWVELKNIMIV